MRVTRTLTGARLRFAGIPARSMHLFVAGGAGLQAFRHERLERERDGSFAVDLALPDAGLYMAFGEFVDASGRPQMTQHAFTTGSVLMPHASEPVDEPHVSNGVRAAIDTSQLKSGRESTVSFDLTDDVSDAPIAVLEPYMSAMAHLFLLSADLTEGRHVQAPDTSRGPRLVFSPIVVPRAGRYKVWLQVQRGGRVATIPFVIDVV